MGQLLETLTQQLVGQNLRPKFQKHKECAFSQAKMLWQVNGTLFHKFTFTRSWRLLSNEITTSDYLAGAGFGRSIVNTQPLPGRLRTRSEPPFASTPRRLIPRPRPKPDRSPFRCSNSRNRSSASPGGRPPHSSSTSIKTRAADENVFSETRL
jgi:hypothetical protein